MRRTMTVALAGLLALGLAATAVAQDPAQTELEMKRDAKKAEAWVTDNGFVTDYTKAKEMAAATGKPIFAYFTRSYSP